MEYPVKAYVHRKNIERLRKQIENAVDDDHRNTLMMLLAEEENREAAANKTSGGR
ncbi:MAG: hypothetical protein WDM84_10195 [Bauldia sp.]